MRALFVVGLAAVLGASSAQAFAPVSCYFKAQQEVWLIDGKTMRRIQPGPSPEKHALANYRREGHTDTWSITINGQPLAGGLEIFDRKAAGWSQGTATIWARCEKPLNRSGQAHR